MTKMFLDPLPPAVVDFEWLRRPFGPTLDPQRDLPGVLRIGRRLYSVWGIGWNEPGGPRAVGFELLDQQTNRTYNIFLEWWGPECDCGEGRFHFRAGGCRHIVNVRAAFDALGWKVVLPRRPAA